MKTVYLSRYQYVFPGLRLQATEFTIFRSCTRSHSGRYGYHDLSVDHRPDVFIVLLILIVLLIALPVNSTVVDSTVNGTAVKEITREHIEQQSTFKSDSTQNMAKVVTTSRMIPGIWYRIADTKSKTPGTEHRSTCVVGAWSVLSNSGIAAYSEVLGFTQH